MYFVAIANELIRDIRPVDSKSVLVLNQMEFRVRYLLISLIQKDDSEFDAIDISIPEFAKYFDLKWGGPQTKTLKYAIENLIENKYILDKVTVKWLSDESYLLDGNIHLKLDDSLIPYLLQLKNYFTLYNYEFVAKFRSKYSYRMYEFLKSVEGVGFYKISLDDAIFLLSDNCCKTKSEFVKRVLTPALNDINMHSDLKIKRKFHKPFGKPEQLWFSIRNKSDDTPQENIIYHSKPVLSAKKVPLDDENLTLVSVDMDNRIKNLVEEARQEMFRKPSQKTKPRRFKGQGSV